MTFFELPAQERKHRCNPPTWASDKRGWRCDCGKAYTLEFLDPRDTNPGELPYQWVRASQYDKKE